LERLRKKLIGQLASIKYSTTRGGLTMTSYSNCLVLVYNALGRVSEFRCVTSKTTALVNMTIMDFFSHIWIELPTWPDTLLKTLTKQLYLLQMNVLSASSVTEWFRKKRK